MSRARPGLRAHHLRWGEAVGGDSGQGSLQGAMTLKVEGKARVAEGGEEAELKAHVCGRRRMGTGAPGRGAV